MSSACRQRAPPNCSLVDVSNGFPPFVKNDRMWRLLLILSSVADLENFLLTRLQEPPLEIAEKHFWPECLDRNCGNRPDPTKSCLPLADIPFLHPLIQRLSDFSLGDLADRWTADPIIFVWRWRLLASGESLDTLASALLRRKSAPPFLFRGNNLE